MTCDSNNLDENMVVGGKYAKYILFLLTLALTLNLIDRQILSILAEDIKVDLDISDSQIGFLYGTSFAVFYAIFGLTLGRLADVGTRKNIIAGGLFLWSSMTMLSGAARGFISLTLCRFGVGVGEASLTPSAYSLLADWFKPHQRATVLSVYTSGAYLGMGASMFIGGTIVEAWNASYPIRALAPLQLAGWQMAFFAVGLPGIILTFVIAKTIEPKRTINRIRSPQKHSLYRGAIKETMAILPPFSLAVIARRDGFGRSFLYNISAIFILTLVTSALIKLTSQVSQWLVLAVGLYSLFSWSQSLRAKDPDAFQFIFRSRSMALASIAFPFTAFITYGFGLWTAPYFVRKFDVGLAEVGIILGLSTAVLGGIGVVCGGLLADRLRMRFGREHHALMGIICAITATLSAVFLLKTDNLIIAYAANAMLQFFGVLWSGAGSSIITEIVPAKFRASGSAFYLAMITFIGLALGPFTIGYLSDLFFQSGSSNIIALNKAMLLSLLVFIPVVIASFLLKRSLAVDLIRVDAYENSSISNGLYLRS